MDKSLLAKFPNLCLIYLLAVTLNFEVSHLVYQVINNNNNHNKVVYYVQKYIKGNVSCLKGSI